MTARYTTVSIPEELGEGIDKFIEDNKHLGLRSRAQCINLSLRMLFMSKQNIIKEDEEKTILNEKLLESLEKIKKLLGKD